MALRPERQDLTPLPDLLPGQSRSGPVRQQRPVYVDLLPPCNAGCPAGENIQAWLAHAEAGDHERAWRQLVIGAGPSGLSAAYHLARLGHEVEIRDVGERPGGMMRYGIPAYRMPRDVLDGELDRIAALGVPISC